MKSQFTLWFKMKVRDDLGDPSSRDKVVEQAKSFAGKKPTRHEDAMSKAYEDHNGEFDKTRRMNGYFWSLLILCGIGYGFWQAIGAPRSYLENRGVDCPPDSSFLDCLSTYVDQYANLPLLWLMGLILLFVITVVVYESMRHQGEEVTEDDNDGGKKWLQMVDEDSRRLTPFWLGLILMLFLLLEAAAITLIASSFVADLTRAAELWVGIFVGLVSASVLGWLVHNAGEQLYCNSMYKGLNRLPDDKKEAIREVSPTFDFTKKPSQLYLWVSVVVVVGLVTLAFMQRYNLNMAILEDQGGDVISEVSLYDGEVPPEIAELEQQDAGTDVDNREESGLIAALAVLSIIFVLVNFFGGWIGYHYSLCCDKSKKSYKNVHKYRKWTASKRNLDKIQEKDNKKLYGRADNFFAKYFSNLVKEADKFSEYKELHKSLESRGQWTMDMWLSNQNLNNKNNP